MARPLVVGLRAVLPRGWTGLVGANGAGKTTVLLLACGLLRPQSGRINRPASVVYCPQRTDEPPPLLGELLDAGEAAACSLRARLGLRADWARQWGSLSHGERKRAQIAVALWRRPEALALDEPSNHIDAAARDLLVRELRRYGGIGLLVSHDRQMLDGLCGQCLFLEAGSAVLRPGGYTKGRAAAEAEHARARKLHDQARSEFRRLNQELTRRRQEAAAEHKVRSKRGLALRDHDGREKIDRARVADGKAGAGYRQLQGRVDQAAGRLAGVRVRKEAALGIWLSEARSRRDWLFRAPAGRLALGPGRALEFPELAMRPTDRVAIVGPNGCGKSTLLGHLVAGLDLPSVECLEEALGGCPGGLLLVSHDTRFLSRLTTARWEIRTGRDIARLRILPDWE